MDRLKVDIIWIDAVRIEVLVNDRTVWYGDSCVVDLLKQLKECGYITLTEHETEQSYLALYERRIEG